MMLRNEQLFAIADEALTWLENNGFKNQITHVTINRDLTVKEIKIKKTLNENEKAKLRKKFGDLF